jgi:hypothetical protein
MTTQYVEQVGGTHYGTSSMGHWDYCDMANVSYLEGCATKYIFRWKDKNGVQDLKKALSYVEKRLKSTRMMFGNPDLTKFNFFEQERQQFYAENKVNVWERDLCETIFGWKTPEDLERAAELLTEAIEELQ